MTIPSDWLTDTFGRFHLHRGVQPQKIHMFVQIAVAMCADLQIPSLIANENDGAKKAELERTYLGLYYMSSW